MRFLLVWLCACVPLCAAADTDPDVLRAQLGIERLRALADAGAIPRSQVEEAQDSLADTQDLALLRRGLYATSLTPEQSEEMVAAAKRHLERRQKRLDKARTLVDAGIVARNDLDVLSQDVEFAQKQYDLTVTTARLNKDLADLARAEQALRERTLPPPASGRPVSEHYDGNGLLTAAEMQGIESSFARQFDKPLPISALGETAVHRALGFDHRGRVDVALSPDQPEGVWLLHYLESQHIPYFAFRQAVPGKATGAHIHIGPESTRLAAAD